MVRTLEWNCNEKDMSVGFGIREWDGIDHPQRTWLPERIRRSSLLKDLIKDLQTFLPKMEAHEKAGPKRRKEELERVIKEKQAELKALNARQRKKPK